MGKLFTVHYWFDPTPGGDFKYWVLMLVFAFALIAAASGVKAYRNKSEDKILKKMIKKYPSRLMWFGVVAGLLTLIRLENITLFAMRFWWIVYFALLIYVAVTNVQAFYKDYPRKVRQSLAHQKKKKYVPEQKTKRKKKG